MNRKFARLNLTREMVKSIFLDVESWPLWFPGVETTDVSERTAQLLEVSIRGRYMGYAIHGELECRIEDNGFFQHQRKGWVKRWDTHWRFLEPPDGRGTTLSCEVDLDFGLMGALMPTALVDRFVDRVFLDTVAQLEARAQVLAAEREEIVEDSGGQ